MPPPTPLADAYRENLAYIHDIGFGSSLVRRPGWERGPAGYRALVARRRTLRRDKTTKRIWTKLLATNGTAVD